MTGLLGRHGSTCADNSFRDRCVGRVVCALEFRFQVRGRTKNFDWDAVLEAFEVQDRKATVSLYFTRWHRPQLQNLSISLCHTNSRKARRLDLYL